jgi:predicted double-glycine peptidase
MWSQWCAWKAEFVHKVTSALAIAAIASAHFTLAVATAAANPAHVLSMREIRQQSIVLQRFDLSCGAAALATILRYQHGEDVTEREVAIGLISRQEYLENPDLLRIRQGFSLLDMNRYVESIDYAGEALGGVTYEDLQNLAPAIVPVRFHGYNHFVVFRGALGGNVLLGDPAYGNRTMSRARFIASWIDYAETGRVAFTVSRRDGLIPPNRLRVTPDNFVVLD